MSDFTLTTNYGLKKPIVGADSDNWGFHVNDDMDTLDALIKTQIEGLQSAFLPLTGGALTGPLTLPGPPVVDLGAATKGYVDTQIGAGGPGPFLKLSGGTLTGLLTLSGPPVAGLHAATKSYVDTQIGAGGPGPFLKLSGGTLTGLLTLSGPPVAGLHAATKSYVDTAAGLVSALSLGFVGDGTTDNSAAIAALFALTGNQTVVFPPGVYNWGTPTGVSRDAASNISIHGVDRDKTIFRLNPGSSVTTHLYRWYQKSGFSLRNFTLDLNTPTATAPAHLNILFTRSSKNFVIDNIGVINGCDNTNEICVSADAGTPSSDFWITNCVLHKTAPNFMWGRAITLTAASGATITRGHIQDNEIINTGIGLDGSYHTVTGNDISLGWGGIWSIHTSINPESGHNLVIGNHVHDMALGLNGDSVPGNGFDLEGDFDFVANNVCERIGGSAFTLFGRDSIFIGNRAYGCGRNTPARGPYDQAGFRVPTGTGMTFGARCKLIGNISADDGGGTQLYGYYEQAPGLSPGIALQGNMFSGVTAPVSIANATAVDGATRASVSTIGAAPVATTSTTAVMVGLGVQITPVASGILDVRICVNTRNNTASNGLALRIRYGTGTPPANAAAVTGTPSGTGLQNVNGAGGTPTVPMTLMSTITGLTRGTTYWIDLSYAALTGGSVTLNAVDVMVTER